MPSICKLIKQDCAVKRIYILKFMLYCERHETLKKRSLESFYLSRILKRRCKCEFSFPFFEMLITLHTNKYEIRIFKNTKKQHV